MPGGSDDVDEPVTIIDQDGLQDLIPDPSDWIDGEPTRQAAQAAAESLNAG